MSQQPAEKTPALFSPSQLEVVAAPAAFPSHGCCFLVRW